MVYASLHQWRQWYNPYINGKTSQVICFWGLFQQLCSINCIHLSEMYWNLWWVSHLGTSEACQLQSILADQNWKAFIDSWSSDSIFECSMRAMWFSSHGHENVPIMSVLTKLTLGSVFDKVTSRCLEFRVTPRVYFLRYLLRILAPSALSVRACALTLSAIQVISTVYKFLPKKTAF